MKGLLLLIPGTVLFACANQDATTDSASAAVTPASHAVAITVTGMR
jgi:hypothetical protein